MSSHFVSIKQSSGGASAYAKYVAAPVEILPSVEGSEIGGGDTASYAAYVGAGSEEGIGRWLGAQADAWGLLDSPVDVETLRMVLDHRDPTSGQDLDQSRIRSEERWAADRLKWQRARNRWDALPQLGAAADAFEALVLDAEAHGGVVATASIEAHLSGHLTSKQIEQVTTAVCAAAASGRSEINALRMQQARKRFVPPALRMAKEPPAGPSREVIGYDLTLSTPKSVSLLMADPATRAKVIASQDKAVAAAVALVERELTAIRSGAGGAERSAAVGLAAAAVNHFTSRPAGDPPLADPSLHTHVVLSALVQGLDGDWSSVDSRTWMKAKAFLDRFYSAELRTALTEELGVDWRQRTTRDPITGREGASWEVVMTGDVDRDDALIDAFSRRTADMRAEAEATRADGKKVSKDIAWRRTRGDKDEVPLAECSEQWSERLEELGVMPGQLSAMACGRVSPEVHARAVQSRSRKSGVVFADLEHRLGELEGEERTAFISDQLGTVEAVAERLAAATGWFSRIDLVKAVADAVCTPSGAAAISGEEIVGQVNAWLLNVGVTVEYGLDGEDPTAWREARFTTDAQLEMEIDVLDTVGRLRETAAPAVSAVTAEQILEMYRRAEGGAKGALNAEQVTLFLEALRSENGRLTTCVAPAGAGKSYVAAAIAAAHRLEHGDDAQVIAVALASAAGDALSKDLLDAEADLGGSIDRLIFHLDRGKIALSDKSLVIIDEAGMASTERLGEVLGRADLAGARVLMFGDHLQLDSPGQAGGLLRYISSTGGAVEFDDTMRARDEMVRAQQVKWRSALDRGDVVAATETLNFFANEGGVTVADGELAARTAAFEQWKALYLEAKAREADWEAKRDCLEADVRQAGCLADRKGAEASLAEHVDERSRFVDNDLLVMATTHEDVALLNDQIQDFLVERGDLSMTATVEGRRGKAPGRDEFELLTAADGSDLSQTTFMKGMAVRITSNTNSGHLQERIAELRAEIAHNRAAASSADVLQDSVVEIGDLLERSAELRGAANPAVDVVTVPDLMAEVETRNELAAQERAARESMAEAFAEHNQADAEDGEAADTVAERKAAVAETRELSATERMVAREAMTDNMAEMGRLIKEAKESTVLNGQSGTVEAVHPEDGGMTVRVRGGAGEERLVRMSASQLEAGLVVPGMAITAHAAQGSTVSHSVLLAGDDASANLMYVGMSRAKGDAHLVYRGDLDLKDPRLVQWETDKREAERSGKAFVRRPPPPEKVPGLWQVERTWSEAASSKMAFHLAADAGLVVTETDRDRARALLDAIEADSSDAALLEATALDWAQQRVAQSATAHQAEQQRVRDRAGDLTLTLTL